MGSALRKMAIRLAALAMVIASVGIVPVQAQGTKLKVVATFSILGDLVKNVGGDKLDLKVMVGADGDAHTYEPKPADSKTLVESALIFEIGQNFEEWLPELVKASGSKAKRVVVTEGLTLLEGEHEHGDGKKADTGATKKDEHEGEAKDPHVWHDVQNTIKMVNLISAELSKADAPNAATYKANAEKYVKELEALDKFIKDEVAKLPKESRKLVTSHDAFGYLAQAYGFEVIGWALPTSTEAADPSAKQIAELVTLIKASKVKAIFAENITDAKLMERIAKEAGVKVAPALFSDALTTSADGDTYLKMVRYNIVTIINALK